MKSVFISALAQHHPREQLDNAALCTRLNTSDAWIIDRTGIASRRRVAPNEEASDLGAEATRQALVRAGWAPQDLELLVCATSSPDTLLPAAATHMARKLGGQPIAFDVNAACAGAAYGLAVAQSMMHGMGYARAALCCVDTYTRFTDYDDRRTAVLFGDGAATALLQTTRPPAGAELLDLDLRNEHEHIELVQVPRAGTWRLQGRAVVPPALAMLVGSAERLLSKHGLTVGDLRGFVGHQANYRILETLAERLRLSDSQHWSNVREYGNQGAAGALSALSEAVAARGPDSPEPLRDGDLILLTVVGAGFTSGSALFRWFT